MGYNKARFWEIVQGRYVGSIHIQTNPTAIITKDELKKKLLYIFGQIGVDDLTIDFE